MNRLRVCTCFTFLSMATAALARPTLLDLHENEGPAHQATTRPYTFIVPQANTRLAVHAKVALTQGRLGLRVLDPAGKVIHDCGSGTAFTIEGAAVPTTQPGEFQVEARPEGAVGEWSVRVVALPPPATFRLSLLSGPLMIGIALAFAIYWKVRSKTLWRWFWVGAAAWTIGVALKFAWAILLNAPILAAMKRGLPAAWYVPLGSLYIGLLTGVFEVAVTLLIAWIWRQLAADAGRAVAVGIGAGSIEALLLGIIVLAYAVLLVSGYSPADLTEQQVAAMQLTPLMWLTGPAERVLAILGHISSRTLTLLSVATRRWRYFWLGFALLTLDDTLAGYFHLADRLATINLWWIELIIVPVAVVSIPIIRWCIRHWPPPAMATPIVPVEPQ